MTGGRIVLAVLGIVIVFAVVLVPASVYAVTEGYWWQAGLMFLAVLLPAGLWYFKDRPAWVRRRRRDRGQCERCGYDLTGDVSGTWPECGTVASVTPSG